MTRAALSAQVMDGLASKRELHDCISHEEKEGAMTDDGLTLLIKQLEEKIDRVATEIQALKDHTDSSSSEGKTVDQLSGSGQKISDILKIVQDLQSKK